MDIRIIDIRFINERPSGISTYLNNNINKFFRGKKIVLISSNKNFSFDADVVKIFESKIHPMSPLSILIYIKLFFWLFVKGYYGRFEILYPHYSFIPVFTSRTSIILHDLFPLEINASKYYNSNLVISFFKKIHFKFYLNYLVPKVKKVYFASVTTYLKYMQYLKYKNINFTSSILYPIEISIGTNLQSKSKTIYYIGDDREHKNIFLIINFMNEQISKGLFEKGLLIGPQKKITNLPDKIIQTGIISENNYKKLLSENPTLLFLSSTEGFGIPVIEAMNFNCSLVLSDIPVFREITMGYDNKIFIDINNLSY